MAQKKYFMATVEILLAVKSETDGCDAISETMRPLLKEFSDNPSETVFVDWRYADGSSVPEPHDGAGFEYATDDDGWSEDDGRAAGREGWMIAGGIERIDDMSEFRMDGDSAPTFAGDDDALAFVQAQADAGSDLHKRALAYVADLPDDADASPDDADVSGKPHIVITGNPVDGFTYAGPYADSAAAADSHATHGGDWWIAPLAAPDGDARVI